MRLFKLLSALRPALYTRARDLQARSVQVAEQRADQELDRLMGDITALLADNAVVQSPDRDQSAIP